MRRKSKYNLNRYRSRPRRRGWYWILLLLGVGAFGWFWWQNKIPYLPRLTRAPEKPAKTVAAKPPSEIRRTNAPPVVTNAPPPKPVVTNAPPKEIPKPVPEPPDATRPAENVLEAQIALARRGISCGPLDGVLGSQTRAALRVYQKLEKLPVTGALDPATRERLSLAQPLMTSYTVTATDLNRLQPLPRTWLGKSQRDRLDYETILELVAEKGHAHPQLVQRLNPGVVWTNVTPGTRIVLPEVDYPGKTNRAAWLRISLRERTLQAWDARTNLLAHFPCSIALRLDKRPLGQLRVVSVIPDPNYVFNPQIFPESAEARKLGRKLTLPPGPNNPVGTVWIGLDKSGYGIHGTPRPEEVGRTESHGCFRLANWNVEYLAGLVTVGMPVRVVP